MSKTAVGILGGDDELLQSFVRVGLHSEGEDNRQMQDLSSGGVSSGGGGMGASGNSGSHPISHPKAEAHLVRQYSDHMSDFSDKNASRKYRNLFNEPIDMKKRRYFDEVYTDKDRAAAVSIGNYDIKQNLLNKRRQERTDALQLPEQADPGAILALGMREIKNRNLDNAVHFLSKALEMNNNDQSALVARSKCYLQLGEPAKALQDAETALLLDKSNIRAIYQKAEALYYLGQFEHSLMFFHRGLRLRPELASFRLGVQKTQEAIENTIGSNTKNQPQPKKTPKAEKPKTAKKVILSREEMDKRAARRLLGDLYVDKEYLENLLKHPDLKKADTNTEGVSEFAKDAINFLNNRQEFWRQQKPCTSLNAKKIDSNSGGLPRW
ncbi:outer dynein arm-docking complex subunit 4 [Wyeomyia smithii]|uniref:outer dynein arm-docking complex subunit 4 n=1 Tax=Wyeomyia smithii TaxID=174621 RepID=UPI002467F874|nr:outer dynein arm-docking complex subunit 4 [Wyeomyia smithii]XP_055534954.1 outer dynein arm-docking complex subunit 4 [Wyeomyia smithii]